jgi:isopenicillin N synthase-like dioxygenase
MAVAMPYPGYPYGYAPLASERLAASLGEATPPDLKESYSMGPPPLPGHVSTDEAEAFTRQPTPWPDSPAGFRAALESYYAAMADLAARLLRLFAQSLRLPPDWFAPFIEAHTSALRLINYPPLDAEPRPGQWRAGAHTDYGTLTILMTEPAPGGLEVLGLDGSWSAVPHVPESFVVNLGDAMARWTNDRWRSTLHRVVPPPHGARDTRRQSIAFFHNANWDARIACIPTCLAPGETPRYAPTTAGAHLMEKFRKTQG